MTGTWQTLDLLILPLLAGWLVLSTHVPLGLQVLDRGIVFMDLAIAQMAGLGVMVADVLGWQGALAVQASALSFAGLSALLLTWTERHAAAHQEALIGVLFVLAASAGLLLIAHHPHGGEHLKDLLAGQILWVDATHLLGLGLSSGVILWFMHSGGMARMGRLGFYAVFAVAVTVSVQLVGVYLVFSSLIIPALGTRHLQGRLRLRAAYAMGTLAYALGLLISVLWDAPTGAVIVWTLALCGLLTSVWRPCVPTKKKAP